MKISIKTLLCSVWFLACAKPVTPEKPLPEQEEVPQENPTEEEQEESVEEEPEEDSSEVEPESEEPVEVQDEFTKQLEEKRQQDLEQQKQKEAKDALETSIHEIAQQMWTTSTKKLEQNLADIQKLEEKYPDNLDIKYNKGLLLDRLGKTADANES